MGRPASGSLGLAALVSIGAGGGILSVLGPTGQMAGGPAYLSFVADGIVAAVTGTARVSPAAFPPAGAIVCAGALIFLS